MPSTLLLYLLFLSLKFLLSGADAVVAEKVAGERCQILLAGTKNRYGVLFPFVFPVEGSQLTLPTLILLFGIGQPHGNQFLFVIDLSPQAPIDLLFLFQ